MIQDIYIHINSNEYRDLDRSDFLKVFEPRKTCSTIAYEHLGVQLLCSELEKEKRKMLHVIKVNNQVH